MKVFLPWICLLLVATVGILYAQDVEEDQADVLSVHTMGEKILFDLKILQEKPVLLSFFSMGCKPCIREMAALEEMNKVYNDRLKILLVSNSKTRLHLIKRFLQEKNITRE